MFGWWRERKRRRMLAAPAPEVWNEVLARLPFVGALERGEQERLLAIARIIASEKRWEACGGLELTEEMPVWVSLQAALLLLGLEHDHFRAVESIFIYPSAYLRPGSRRPEADAMEMILGEAWLQGPMVLAWDATQRGALHPHDGRNLVLHEFAHKLDMMDGLIDGTPPLARREDYARWREVCTREYARLLEDVEKGRKPVLDRYGATNVGEFFAVATETFFEKPEKLRRRLPELYSTLAEYYRQDPAARPRVARGREDRDG